jgi:hypothetical protein
MLVAQLGRIAQCLQSGSSDPNNSCDQSIGRHVNLQLQLMRVGAPNRFATGRLIPARGMSAGFGSAPIPPPVLRSVALPILLVRLAAPQAVSFLLLGSRGPEVDAAGGRALVA